MTPYTFLSQETEKIQIYRVSMFTVICILLLKIVLKYQILDSILFEAFYKMVSNKLLAVIGIILRKQIVPVNRYSVITAMQRSVIVP